MAATRIIPLHINKGRTLAQCLTDRTDYAKNPEKTEKGELVTSYECDPMTVDEEFLLAKRQYEHITRRRQDKNIIAYQIRQSFRPGEITPAEANQAGYELAMRFTKGKHAFIVATHTDRAHVHNHIIFNSTSLDCKKKFRNFFLSYRAVQRLSDLICAEHGLSIIEPKPYRERVKRTDYPKKATCRDAICTAIDEALRHRPKDFEALLRLLEQNGYEVKRGKNPAVRGKGQQRFIRFRSLGEGYTEDELRAALLGEKMHRTKQKSGQVHSKPEFCLLIDIQSKMADKGAGYQRWATVYNLKQMAQTMLFLREHGIDTIDQLREKTVALCDHFDGRNAFIKASETRLSEIAVLKKHILNYRKTRDTYVAYRKAGYSKKFFEAHREEITLHKAAKEAFDQLGVKKLPTIRELNTEYAEVLNKKKQAYREYRAVRSEMQEYLRAQKNVEQFFALEQQVCCREQEQNR